MAIDDKHFVKIVAEDLNYLLNEWDQEISDDSLRRNSTVLRRLLVEGDYSNAWRMIGLEKEPKICAENYHDRFFRNNVSLNQITLALAGGAIYHGMQIEGIRHIDISLSDTEIEQNAKIVYKKEAIGLSQYLNGVSIIILKTEINKRELIQYIANKLGGAHFDSSRNGSRAIELKFEKLDYLYNNQVEIAEKKAIYFELLSIGQCIAHSRSTEKFLKNAHVFLSQ